MPMFPKLDSFNKLTQLTTVSSGLVQSLGTESPSVNQILDLLLLQRSGLSESHSSHRGTLNVRSRDGSVDNLVGDLSTSVSELSDTERSVSFGGGDDRSEVLDGVPGLLRMELRESAFGARSHR